METKTIHESIESDKSFTYHYIGNPTTSKKPSTFKHKTRLQQNNDLCGCDSGLKYKKCCK